MAQSSVKISARGSVVSSMVEEIIASIGDGRLVPGQHLSEPEIALANGVSRSTAREAFQRLAAGGLSRLRGSFRVQFRPL